MMFEAYLEIESVYLYLFITYKLKYFELEKKSITHFSIFLQSFDRRSGMNNNIEARVNKIIVLC